MLVASQLMAYQQEQQPGPVHDEKSQDIPQSGVPFYGSIPIFSSLLFPIVNHSSIPFFQSSIFLLFQLQFLRFYTSSS